MFKRIAQGIVGVVLIAALFYFGLIDLKLLRRVIDAPVALAVTIALSFLAIVISGIRWHVLLLSQGLVLQLRETLRICIVAAFFGTFIPGGTGGDLVKGLYVFRATQDRRVSAVFSILIDHLVGLLGFLCVGALALLFHSRSTLFDMPLLVFTAASACGGVVFLLFGHRIAGLAGNGSKLGHKIEQITSALECYSRSGSAIVKAILLSMVIAGLSVACIAILAHAIGFDRLAVGDYGVAYVYATIAGLLPITPSGIGVGEAGFVAVCLEIDPAGSYATVFVLFRIVAIIASLPGLLLYWMQPKEISFQK